jgi:hypothetical protein
MINLYWLWMILALDGLGNKHPRILSQAIQSRNSHIIMWDSMLCSELSFHVLVHNLLYFALYFARTLICFYLWSYFLSFLGPMFSFRKLFLFITSVFGNKQFLDKNEWSWLYLSTEVIIMQAKSLPNWNPKLGSYLHKERLFLQLQHIHYNCDFMS